MLPGGNKRTKTYLDALPAGTLLDNLISMVARIDGRGFRADGLTRLADPVTAEVELYEDET